MTKIIGIDLGTSTSEVAVIMDGKPFLIPNENGDLIIPSIIGLDQGQFIVGQRAADRQLLYPEDTVVEVKRRMGDNKRLQIGNKYYTPEEISSQILIYLKSYAEDYLKEPVKGAVITVPAYFNNEQRKATVEAGRLAGLDVKRIINEPTAAALCYGIDHMQEESKILVYDLGGGTFDVTLLEMFDGVLEVKASSGNNELGGKEFDERIIEYLLAIVREKYQIDLKNDVYAMVKLREAAIQCKIALSSNDSYDILLPMLAQVNGVPITLHETITVELFEKLISDLIEKTSKPIDVVLEDAGYTSSDIDLILLVGGSTKIPYVSRYIEKLLGKKPERLIDPDMAVALGAAIQGGILNDEIDAQAGIMLTDVMPYALGVRVMIHMYGMPFDDYMDVLIPRNVTIPMSTTKRYETAVDNQKYALVEVYQGEQKIASDNILLGKFEIGEFPRGKAGKEKIDVKFSYDLNGILVVTATVVSTGQAATISFDVTESEESSDDIDISNWDKAPMARKFRSTVRKCEKWLEDIEEDTPDSNELEELLIALKGAIVLNREIEEIEDIESDIFDLLDEIG